MLFTLIMIFFSFVVAFCFIPIAQIKDTSSALPKQQTLQPDKILTDREAGYMLYGEGKIERNTDTNLHEYIRSMTSRSTPGEPRRAGRSGRLHYSQHGQSQHVDKLLKGRRNGVFLECGAMDGERFSNSLFFEIYRNWTGILIEANPEQLRSLINRNRNAFVVRACLSITTRPQIMKYAVPHTNIGGALSSALDDHVVKWFRKVARSNAMPEIYVQCFPLLSILDALDIYHIDYLSLDVEGAEIEILKTVNWEKLTVDVLTIEYRHSLNNLKELRDLFKKTGNYKESGFLPAGTNETSGQDVVFIRIYE